MSFRARVGLLVVTACAVGTLVVGGIALAARTHRNRVFHGTAPVLTAAQIRRLSAGAKKRTIIIFKNQLTNLPARGRTMRARASAASSSQAMVRTELARVHATGVHSFQIINAMSASVSTAEAAHLQANPAVLAVVPDVFRHFDTLGSGPGPALPALSGSNAPAASPQQICPPDPAHPIVEPEARTVMNADAAEQLADGTGVKVGIIADGIDPNNPDLIRPNGQHVIFDYQDFSGFGNDAPTDGREAFLDAGTIASQANQTYDLSGFVNPAHPLPPGCNIKIEGIAPGASLAVLNVAGSNAGFFNSQILQAIQWAVMHDHVNVLNESIGGNPLPNTEDDPVALADQAAIAAGVTVVASSGDAGPFNNIGSPATTPGVIAAGGTQTYRVYRQTTRYGTQLSAGGWENNNITALSSSGETEFNPSTVTVVAPGDRGWSLCSSDTTHYFGCADLDHGANPPPIWAAGGTSASAPETSATAALVIEAYANAHGGALPTPATVKQIIVSTATDLGAPADHQGAGLVNSFKAVQLAESINGGTVQGNTLLVHQTALSATMNAHQTHVFSVDVTNEGSKVQTVSPSISGLPTMRSSDNGTVTLDSSSPTYIDGEGHVDSYQLHTFTVPRGSDYLNGDVTWNAQSAGTSVFETLFDPTGAVAAYSLIGADQSGFGHVEVRAPMPGTWTAVIFTVHNAAQYTGPVQFYYTTEAFHSTGLVSPATLTLAPGATGTVHVAINPASSGDESLRLHLGTGGSDDGSIPITIRALVPLNASGGAFAGRLTGGGSTGNAGQSYTYQFMVPSGKPSLGVSLQLVDPNYQLTGYLIDPHGQPVDEQSNGVISGTSVSYGRRMQFFRNAPAAGLWTVTYTVTGPLDGTHVNEPYSGAISFNGPTVTSNGIPDSPSVTLPAGKPVTATIAITNTGNASKDFFADARLNGVVPQILLGSGANNVSLPLSLSAQPNWFIPTHTRSLGVLAQGTVPLTMEASYFSGDPDVGGVSFGNDAASMISAPELAPGFWFGLPEATGPFPAGGVGAGASVSLAAVANTNPFDSAVSADTGDLWAASVDPNATYSPVTIPSGGSGTIKLTITPSAPTGTVVRGFIDVDTFNLVSLGGDEVASIPYTYRVG
jgi:hypothetical protein